MRSRVSADPWERAMSTTRIESYDACYRSSREEPKAIQILGLVAKRLQGRRDNETNYKGALTLTQVLFMARM